MVLVMQLMSLLFAGDGAASFSSSASAQRFSYSLLPGPQQRCSEPASVLVVMVVWQCFIGRETDNLADDCNWEDYAPNLNAVLEARYEKMMNGVHGKYHIIFWWSMPGGGDINKGCTIVELHNANEEVALSMADVGEICYIIDLQKKKQTRLGPEFSGTERPIRRIDRGHAVEQLAKQLQNAML